MTSFRELERWFEPSLPCPSLLCRLAVFSDAISRWEVCTVSRHVSGKVSSEVTKVPLAELRRLFVMESKLLEYMERKDRKKTVKCGER